MRWFFFMLALLSCGLAQAAQPFGRASIDDGEPIVAGQQIHIAVDVFAPNFFVSPPQFPLFEVPGALVTLSSEAAENLTQTIDGVQYAGIRQVYSVVAERSGDFSMPEIAIELGYSNDGKPTKAVVTVGLPHFEVKEMEGQEDAAPFAVVDLKLTQTFDGDPAKLKTGGALVRTITIAAEDTQAMLIPPFDPGVANGLAQYVKPPALKDGIELGTGVGQGRGTRKGSSRTQAIVYTASSEGSFEIPAVSYRWFDIDAQASRVTELPPIEVRVAKADMASDKIDPDLVRKDSPDHALSRQAALWACAAVIVAAAAWFARRVPRLMIGWAHRLRESAENSRSARLRRLRTVIATDLGVAVYRALQDWCGSLGYGSLSEWVKSEGTPQLASQIDILERRLFRSADIDFNRTLLAKSVDTHVRSAPVLESALPPLNPGASK